MKSLINEGVIWYLQSEKMPLFEKSPFKMGGATEQEGPRGYKLVNKCLKLSGCHALLKGSRWSLFEGWMVIFLIFSMNT